MPVSEKMFRIRCLLIFVASLTLVASEEVHLIFILGTTQTISCQSSYPPPWTKIGRSTGDVTIIGVNGEKHAGWTDPRYTFVKSENVYSIQITDVRLKDAGKFICGSDKAVTFLVTVLR